MKIIGPLNGNELNNDWKTINFLDSYMSLRFGGRLTKPKTMSFYCKHPILITKIHPLTEAIICYFHFYRLYAGIDQLLDSR